MSSAVPDTAPRRFGPKAWFILLILVGIPIGAALFWFTPNPFEGLTLDERPSKLLMALKVCGALLALIAFFRLIGLKSIVVDSHGVETRSLLGRKQHRWGQLKSAVLDKPEGVPRAYRLRFETGTIELIAIHWSDEAIEAVRRFARMAGKWPA